MTAVTVTVRRDADHRLPGTMPLSPRYRNRRVRGLVTLEWGRAVGRICLIRRVEGGGTPGLTLCGLERFKHERGWSVGGGQTPAPWPVCEVCKQRAASRPELLITGIHADMFTGGEG